VDEEGEWVLVAKQSGRASKAILRKAAKKKKKYKNVECMRVQTHNGRVSEVTHAAVLQRR